MLDHRRRKHPEDISRLRQRLHSFFCLLELRYNGYKIIMDSSPVARSNVRYLPTEIVHQILCSIENEEGDAEIDLRQSTLYACCLVSKQWYSEAISMLYKNPYIDGSRFQQFAATVCPPLGTREPKYRLASLVRRLDMSGLVHQSSNSVTARLLGRVRTNLEAFTAPMYSFS